MKFAPQIRWVAATTRGLAVVGFVLHFPDGGPDWDLWPHASRRTASLLVAEAVRQTLRLLGISAPESM